MLQDWEIYNAEIIGPKLIRKNQTIRIHKNRISEISENPSGKNFRLDLHGLSIYPGLINSYDHLLSSYLPRVGAGRPYLNWLAWDNDLKSSAVYTERQQLDTEELYLLGSYKNLISCVTTVMDHIPHFVQDPYIGRMPIRIISKFHLSHSACSYSLNWGEGVKKEYSEAVSNNLPYITGIAEGFDPESVDSLRLLEKENALGENSVLVHCLGLKNRDLEIIADKSASVVWCPNSNLFKFNKTLNVKKLLDLNVNLCLGTDTPMAGGLNIFEEIKTAREVYKNTFGEELNPKKIFRMLTTNPAKAFRIEKDCGEIEKGKFADLVILETKKSDPYENLCEADLSMVKLVIIDGKPVYGDMSLLPFFEEFGINTETISIQNTDKIIQGSPLSLLKSIQKAVGYKKDLAFLPIR
ncbi:MAG: amidohydrolase family protein [Leptospiraceae bacterium]|nr:amidohydrolase family protein [Leptospiraceae bacterium]MCK6382357.1 amidohydrolase family protein [Leptospiraceae bacterium]NUM41447.1 amidohydrolase family protein [Leptospiraceae bacterium]